MHARSAKRSTAMRSSLACSMRRSSGVPGLIHTVSFLGLGAFGPSISTTWALVKIRFSSTPNQPEPLPPPPLPASHSMYTAAFWARLSSVSFGWRLLGSGIFEAVSPPLGFCAVGSLVGVTVSGAVPPVVVPGTLAGLLVVLGLGAGLTSVLTAASAPSGLASGVAFLATSTWGVGFGSSFLPPARNTAAPAPTATSAPTSPPIRGSFDFDLGAATGPPRRRTVATGASPSSSTTATGRRRTLATGASSSSSTTAARVLRAGAVDLAANAVWHDLQRIVLPRYASGTSARAPHSGH